MSDQIIVLSDRIKELSHSIGTGSLRLDGAATGFSAFGDFYESGDALYYAVTDGTDYEVGSGQYLPDGSTNSLVRFPFRSTNSNNAVDFAAGVKEVYVTYPGQYAVFTASGLGDFKEPKPSGLAFWGSSQILCHDDALVWSPSGNKLGITQPDPQYALDIGGTVDYSQIQASGFLDGGSGILFSGGQTTLGGTVASGGRQLEPFVRNELDATTGSNAVFALSGLVDQRITLLKQDTNTFFAGPISGCADGSCTPDYPSFRLLNSGDIPDLGDFYIVQDTNMGIDASTIPAGSVALYKESGIVTYDPQLVFLKTDNRLGINIPDPRTTLDVNGAASVSGDFWASGDSVFSRDMVVGRDTTVSGDLMFSGGLTGDLFQIGDSAAASGDISGQYLLSISGVSGIHTEFTTDPASNSGLLLINPSGLSGVMQYQLDNAVSYAGWSLTDGTVANDLIGGAQTVIISGASGVGTHYNASTNMLTLNASGISGVLTSQIASNLTEIRANSSSGNFNLTEIRTNSASGNFNLTEIRANSASGVAISGWNKVYTDTAVLAAGSYTHWTFTDGTVAGDNITTAQTFTVSGASGVGTHYDASTNMLTLNASGLSGVLRYDIDNATTYAGWNITDGWVADDLIAGGQTVTISGVSGVGTHYDASTNMLVLNPSGLSGVMQSQIDGISVGSTAAGSGLTKVVDTIHMDIDGSGQLEHLIFNNDQIRIGTSGGDSFDLGDSGSYWIAIGTAAGYGASGNDSTVMIGQNAGKLSSGCDYTNMIGSGAGHLSTGCVESTMIGQNAGYNTQNNTRTDIIGGHAGYAALDCANSVMIGGYSAYRASGCNLATMVGVNAGLRASGNYASVMVGLNAGYESSGCPHGTMVGGGAGYGAKLNGTSTMIGYRAGIYSTESHYTNIIGNHAAFQASGCDYLIAIGKDAAFGAIVGSHNTALGWAAGSGMEHVNSTNMMGYQAGLHSSGNYSSTFIGVNAGKDSANAVTGVYLGESAASYGSGLQYSVGIGLNALAEATGIQSSVALGHSAGTYAEDIKLSEMIGRHAGQSASGTDYGTMIGYEAGAYSTGCDYSVMIGAQAGYHSKGLKNSIFLGYRAGWGGQLNTNNHLIINPSNRIDPGHWVGTIAQHGIIDIADIIHGISNGSTSKVLNIGQTPADLIAALGKTLSIRPAAATDIALKIYKQSSQSADQIQSSITSDGLANTIVNKHGWLQLPVALNIDGTGSTANAYTDATSTEQEYKIDKVAGVVAYYKPAGGTTKHLIVSDGSSWYTTASLTEL